MTFLGRSEKEAFIVINNTSVFYLAQIEAAHAGKTLEIKLFDPGEISDTVFKINLPTTTGFVYPSFTFSTTGSSCGAPTSGGPTTSLRTSDASGCRYYNNQWVTISVPIPATLHGTHTARRTGPGLVEDRVRHARHWPGHHHLGSEHPRQPRSSDHAIATPRGVLRVLFGLRLASSAGVFFARPLVGSLRTASQGPLAQKTPTLPNPLAGATRKTRTSSL